MTMQDVMAKFLIQALKKSSLSTDDQMIVISAVENGTGAIINEDTRGDLVSNDRKAEIAIIVSQFFQQMAEKFGHMSCNKAVKESNKTLH